MEPIGGGGATRRFPGAAIGNPPGVVGEYVYLARCAVTILFKIHNLNLRTEPTPLQSLGAIVCRVRNPILPQHRARLFILDYGSGQSIDLKAPLVVNNGYATISAPEFSRVDYVEIGGNIYTEAEDYTELLPGEYVYNANTEVLTIRIY